MIVHACALKGTFVHVKSLVYKQIPCCIQPQYTKQYTNLLKATNSSIIVFNYYTRHPTIHLMQLHDIIQT